MDRDLMGPNDKVFDYVILDIHADKLTTDEFGYQDNTSTSMCTWLVVETVEYYLRHGSNIYHALWI